MTDEAEWIETFRTDDPERRRALWGRVYSEQRAAVYGLARNFLGDGALAEDVLQETFFAAWRYGPRFRGRGTLRGWLLTIAANLARRSLVRERARSGRDDPPERPGVPQPIDELLSRERAAHVRRALAALPAEQRMAVSLSVVDGLRTDEIAEILGCPAGTVWSRIHHAKRKLAEMIGGTERGEER